MSNIQRKFARRHCYDLNTLSVMAAMSRPVPISEPKVPQKAKEVTTEDYVAFLMELKFDLDMRAVNGVVPVGNGIYYRLCELLEDASDPKEAGNV